MKGRDKHRCGSALSPAVRAASPPSCNHDTARERYNHDRVAATTRMKMHSAGNAQPYADKHCCGADTACHLLDTSAASLVHCSDVTHVH